MTVGPGEVGGAGAIHMRTREVDGVCVAELTAREVVLCQPQDVLELVARGIDRLLLHEHQLAPEFFDLSTGFAGELMQKCGNYGLRVAVVGEGWRRRSDSFRRFVGESNRGGRFVFVPTADEGIAALI